MMSWQRLCSIIVLLSAVSSTTHGDTVGDDKVSCTPEQVHLNFGDVSSEIVVIWETQSKCDTIVHYASHPWNLDLSATGTFVETDNTPNKSQKYIHRVVLKGLKPDETYYYRPIIKTGVGSTNYFKTASSSDDEFLVLSSLGSGIDLINAVTTEAQTGRFAGMFYNGKVNHEKTTSASDTFLGQLEHTVTSLPLLITPQAKDGSKSGTYMNRHFSMPGWSWPQSSDKQWYSVDIGLVHLISYSTDLILSDDTTKAKAQRDWLVHDLTEVNKHRKETPWVIALGSYPMYCSTGISGTDNCASNTSKVRHALEDMFYHFAVDLVIESEFVGYERSYPQYKGVLIESSYTQPRAPVEILLGSSAGDVSKSNNTAEWSAMYLPEAGGQSYGRLTISNASHLLWELCDKDGKNVLDSVWIVQSVHGNFSLANLPHNVSHQINQTIIAMGGKPGTYDFISGSTPSEPGVDGEGLSKYSLWIGLGTLGIVLLLVLGIITLRSCIRRQRRGKSGRRWQEMDRTNNAGNFYSLQSDSDTEDNDFESDVNDKVAKQSSKLLTSY